jgi:1,4-dihydroxy-2-naphthoate octaprenyltransferase
MTGTSCAFLFTKSSAYSCIISIFLHMFNYAVIYNDYHEVSDYVRGFDLEGA